MDIESRMNQPLMIPWKQLNFAPYCRSLQGFLDDSPKVLYAVGLSRLKFCLGTKRPKSVG